jgi:hypothetical protein
MSVSMFHHQNYIGFNNNGMVRDLKEINELNTFVING